MRKSLAEKQKIYRDALTAETLAMLYYLLRGYWPLARRYKTPVGEIDLICRKAKMLVFIECKARPTKAQALEALQSRQHERLRRAALHFMARKPATAALDMRFDLLAIGWKDGVARVSNI